MAIEPGDRIRADRVRAGMVVKVRGRDWKIQRAVIHGKSAKFARLTNDAGQVDYLFPFKEVEVVEP